MGLVYRRPFTPQQRREAAGMYRSYRRHYVLLRQKYPPRTGDERHLLKEYKQALQDFARLLRIEGRRVDVEELNRADASMKWIAIEYLRSRLDQN